MSVINKEFDVKLDIKREDSNRPFHVISGDTGTKLHIYLLDDGNEIDLSGCKIVAVFDGANGTHFQDNTVDGGITVSGEENNELLIELFSGSVSPGTNECEIQVYSDENQDVLVTSSRFNFDCEQALFDDETVKSLKEYSLLTGLIKDVQGLKNGSQSDWNEDDDTKSVFIKNKPSIPSTPESIGAASSTHASQHGIGGSDPISPESIGAMAADAVPVPASHALSHAASGTDPVTPVSIGAERARLQFQNVVVPATSFSADETYEDYPFMAEVALSGVTADMTPEVTLNCADVLSGVFAPVTACYDGGVYLYASKAPEASITIPTIILWKHAAGDDERQPLTITLSVLDQAEYDALQYSGEISSDCLYLIRG